MTLESTHRVERRTVRPVLFRDWIRHHRRVRGLAERVALVWVEGGYTGPGSRWERWYATMWQAVREAGST